MFNPCRRPWLTAGLAGLLLSYLSGCPMVTPPPTSVTEAPTVSDPGVRDASRPAAPLLAGPLTDVSPGPVRLEWAAVPGAESYAVYFGEDPNPPLAQKVAITYYAVPTTTACRTYYWKVETEAGGVASVSAVWSFRTTCPASLPQRPNYPAPTNEAIDVPEATSLHWAAAPNADGYEVSLGTTPNPPYFARTPATSIETPKNLRRGARYYWRIVAQNENGAAPSQVWSFEVVANPDGPGVPRAVYPPNGATQLPTALRLDWLDSPGATGYDVYLDADPAASSLAGRIDASVSEFRPPPLAFGTTYYWRVVAVGTALSASSPLYTFRTSAAPLPPGAPDLGSPPDGAIAVVTDVTLSWREVPNADSYDVYVGASPDMVLVGSTTKPRLKPAAELSIAKAFYWRVVAVNPQGRTPGPVWTFRTGGTNSAGVPGPPPGPPPPPGGGGVVIGAGAGGDNGDDHGPTPSCDAVLSLLSFPSAPGGSGGTSGPVSISASGRFVAFTSSHPLLVSGDTNDSLDVFVHDRASQSTARVSISSAGGEGQGPSRRASISADGRYVAFESDAVLAANDNNGFTDVYLHDRATATTTLITPSSDCPSRNPQISANGTVIAFYTLAQLANNDPGGEDIYVYDASSQTYQRITDVMSDGFDLFGDVAISGDGRVVAFAASDGPSGSTRPMVRDRTTSTISAVGGTGGGVVLSTNGVTLCYFGPGVVAVSLTTGGSTLASSNASGEPADATAWLPGVSGDGRYVSFSSWAGNLTGATDGNFEIFRKDLQTGAIVRLSGATASPTLGSYSALSGGGGVAAFVHSAALMSGDSNTGSDVFATGCAP